MRLSELKTGEKGVVVKVMGHGGFRKRIVEMGFIRGKIVTAVLNAPLQDPVKYKIMGYEISLRRTEAAMIEIMSASEAGSHDAQGGHASQPHHQCGSCGKSQLWQDVTLQFCLRCP